MTALPAWVGSPHSGLTTDEHFEVASRPATVCIYTESGFFDVEMAFPSHAEAQRFLAENRLGPSVVKIEVTRLGDDHQTVYIR